MVMKVQAIRFDKKTYTLQQARKLCKKLGYNSVYRGKSPFTQSINQYRFRQLPPTQFKGYRTKVIGKGIELILGIK